MNADDTDGPPADVADAEILAGRILSGIRILRSHHGCSLQEGLLLFAARYEVLRRDRPGAFTRPHEEYRAGFHS